ncbi:M28 family metallopeptidase [Granulicoccus sp. GXG6511]|uniref:M28 family metallopeptidase n=1 Tax=Granulicoccus sp. GXG6511 TaxID=3381351 RepID=UPI003D7CA6AE
MRSKPLAVVAASAAAGLVLTSLTAGHAVAAPNPNNSQKMRQAVTTEAIFTHLQAFQGIADANGGNRAAGRPGYEASADYVEKTLRAAGYSPTRQYFDFTYVGPATLERVTPNPATLETFTFTGSGSGDVKAAVTAVDLNLEGDRSSTSGCEASDFVGFPSGDIALIQRGTCPFSDKAQNAEAAGASAVIVFNDGAGPDRMGVVAGTLGDNSGVTIPVVGASFDDGVSLASGATARVMTPEPETRTTFNILAETKSGRADNVVMLGAHLDGAEEGPGINDNATGSAAILETAVQLAKVNKLNNKVRFAWWGAEELGLLGSNYYVNDLVENDPAELREIATYLNFDMVGSPNYIIGVYDADESTYPAPVAVPPGSAQTEDVFTGYFDSVNQPWIDTEFSGRSDYAAFIENGVPSSGLFTGADGNKTAEEVALFGGTEGIMYDPNYHTARDTIANVNREAVDIMSDAIAHATITLAQDTSSINGKRSAGKSGKVHPKKELKPAA